MKQAYIDALRRTGDKKQSRNIADIRPKQVENWRFRDERFALESELAFSEGREAVRDKELTRHIFDPAKERPPRPATVDEFLTWRRRYVGRDTPPHVMGFVTAYFDRTNRRVIWKGPSGGGKDTTLGDIVLSEIVSDWEFRVGWLNESQPQAIKRVAERIKPYLENPRTYLKAPRGAGSTIPTGSLIDDYGPFMRPTGQRMYYPNGEIVPASTWDKTSLYFLQGLGEKEQDPNLSAGGITSALEGQRISLFVMSDVFTLRNHGNPATMEAQIANVTGTIENRLDGQSRVVLINHRVGPGDNVERLETEWIADSPVIYEGEFHNTTYVKYANGLAVVTTVAIDFNEEGQEVSFWPAHHEFDLDTYILMPDGERLYTKDLTGDQINAAGLSGGQRIEGLRDKRTRKPVLFATMQQQQPPETSVGEFTRPLLDSCNDKDRTLGVRYPHETGVIGVDPARTFGAAWVELGVDFRAGTLTVCDFEFFTRLGTIGVKERLVHDPMTRKKPRYFGYESNREVWAIEVPETRQLAKDLGITIKPLPTNQNRNEGEWRVSAMAEDMHNGTIRFPAATETDRRKMDLLKEHARNWDSAASAAFRPKPGSHKHAPDDVFMALWLAWRIAKDLLRRRGIHQPHRPDTPDAVRRTWGGLVQQRHTPTKPVTDLIGAYYGNPHAEP